MSHGHRVCFLPYDFRQRKRQRRTNSICAAMFLITIGAVGLSIAISERSIHEAEAVHSDVMRQYAFAAERIAQVRTLQDREQSLAAHARSAAALIDAMPRSFMIAEVTNALPPGVALSALTLNSGPRGSNGGDPRQAIARVKIAGVGQTDVEVAEFVNQLSRSNVLKDVTLTQSVKTADAMLPIVDSKKTFSIDLSLAGVIPVPSEQASTAVELSPE